MSRGPRDPHHVERHDHQTAARSILEDEGLGKQVLRHTLGRLRPRGVAGHPHHFFRRDLDRGGACLPGRTRTVGRLTGNGKEQLEGDHSDQAGQRAR
jgi:hypothetical protein